MRKPAKSRKLVVDKIENDFGQQWIIRGSHPNWQDPKRMWILGSGQTRSEAIIDFCLWQDSEIIKPIGGFLDC